MGLDNKSSGVGAFMECCGGCRLVVVVVLVIKVLEKSVGLYRESESARAVVPVFAVVVGGVFGEVARSSLSFMGHARSLVVGCWWWVLEERVANETKRLLWVKVLDATILCG